MKNIIAITSLLAAGTILANATADSITIDSRYDNAQTSGAFDKYSVYGFKFSLSTSSLVESGLYSLDSIGLAGATAYGTDTPLTTSDTLVFYSVEEGGISYVGASSVSSTSGSYVVKGVGYESDNRLKYTIQNNLYSLTNTTLVLDAEKTYLTVFATTNSYDSNLANFTSATAFSDISSYLRVTRLASGNGAGDIEANIKGVGVNQTGAETSTSYSPFIVATLTPVPEPSAFGLLAGAGALALAAARRRRRSK